MKLTTRINIPEELPTVARIFGGASRSDLIEAMRQDAVQKGATITALNQDTISTEIDLPEETIRRAAPALEKMFLAQNAEFTRQNSELREISSDGTLDVPTITVETEYADDSVLMTINIVPPQVG